MQGPPFHSIPLHLVRTMFACHFVDPETRGKVLAALAKLVTEINPASIPYEGHGFAHLDGELEIYVLIARRKLNDGSPPVGPQRGPPSDAVVPVKTPAEALQATRSTAPSPERYAPTDPTIRLPPLERALRDALTDAPQTPKQLTRKIRRKSKNMSRVYEALRNLCRKGQAEKTLEGYVRKEPADERAG